MNIVNGNMEYENGRSERSPKIKKPNGGQPKTEMKSVSRFSNIEIISLRIVHYGILRNVFQKDHCSTLYIVHRTASPVCMAILIKK